MIQELVKRLLTLGVWAELTLDDLKTIELGTKVITLEARRTELNETVYVMDELTLSHDMIQLILSIHACADSPNTRFFVLDDTQ